MVEEEEEQALSSKSSTQSVQCRVCLGEDASDLRNPIIVPCQCRGTMRHVHLNCLKHWIRQRIEIKEKLHATAVTWKSLTCELCKTPYPFAVYFNHCIYELVSVPSPSVPYLVLEHYNKDTRQSAGLHIISFAGKETLGIVSALLVFRVGMARMTSVSATSASLATTRGSAG